MFFSKRFVSCAAILLAAGTPIFAADHFVSPLGGNNPPYISWADAATNIQDAIDAAATGATVWVTNGLYAQGTKVLGTANTNRIALNKPVTVQSVNGPYYTIIEGDRSSSVRCAWLTNGATLRGFTLRNGGTANNGNGGGAYCYSATPGTGPVIANCLILSNTASGSGGGVYQGIVLNSAMVGNTNASDGGAYNSRMVNCTVSGNKGGGVLLVYATNCIIYSNSIPSGFGGTFAYCCLPATSPGAGNIVTNPLLLGDYIHLAADSPCRGAGTNLVSGVDIDGQAWSNPPAIGCDEWRPAPVVSTPALRLTSSPVGFAVSAVAAGQDPFSYSWLHNGSVLEDDGHYASTHTPVLSANAIQSRDAGEYQLVVSNSLGMVTSPVTALVIHHVDAAAASPAPPYLDWASAAATIQDAIDAAAPGDVVLVTNGVYASGGKVMSGDLLNRVAIYKPVFVQSVNGLASTSIVGAWDAATNGPSAVRCVWMTNYATLAGFTIRGGATRAFSGSSTVQEHAGGVYGSSSNSVVVNCSITGNAAAAYGGGAYSGTLLNCFFNNNRALATDTSGSGGCGGAAAYALLRNCSVNNNYAHSAGGGTYYCTLFNCTVWNNVAGTRSNSGVGGGDSSSRVTNCIVFGNQIWSSSSLTPVTNNYSSSYMGYTCTTPLSAGTGNTNVNPQLLADGIHLVPTSPCRAAGNAAAASGTDIDGQPWANPPSIGCDEWQATPTIFSQPAIQFPSNTFGFSISVVAGGQDPLICFWTHDGAPVEVDGHFTSAHGTALTAKSLLPSDQGNYQVVVSNSFGMATSAVVNLQFTYHCVNAAATNPVPPYSSWETAAAVIQDAIDVASPGDFVIVTDGVYTNGGKVMAGDLTNRIVIDKAITVESVNGPDATIIQGGTAFPSYLSNTNVRCAWLSNGATLVGFTLRYGGTRTNGDSVTLRSGGGVWAASSAATIINCRVFQNRSSGDGGGAYQGTLYGCEVNGNISGMRGGGAYQSALRACYLIANNASQNGGAACSSTLYNCTAIGNWSATAGQGIYGGAAYNSIFQGNDNSSASVYNSCLSSGTSGNGNIFDNPQLINGYQLAAASPCRHAGNPANSSGFDIDGQPWAALPAMGCSEVIDANLVGPLVPKIITHWPSAVPGKRYAMTAEVLGNVSRIAWDFGDGIVSNTASYSSVTHVWTNLGSYTVTLTAYNNDHPSGVSTNLVIPIVPIAPMTITTGLNGNELTFYFDAQPGVSYTLQIATNLAPPISWRNDSTVMIPWGGPYFTGDFPKAGENRFYRIWAH